MADTTTPPGITSLTNFSVPVELDSVNEAMLMPKLKYRFRVLFTNFGLANKDPNLQLTKQVVEANRPTIKFADQKIDVYNSTIHYAGKPNWDPISIKLRDDSTGVVNTIVGQQNQKQFDFFEQSSAAAAGDYKFNMKIQMLDGGNAASFDNSDTSVNILETWECVGCYIISSTFGQLQYSDQGTGMTIDLSIQPDNCIQTVGGGIGSQETGGANRFTHTLDAGGTATIPTPV
jgi:hypothetical protein